MTELLRTAGLIFTAVILAGGGAMVTTKLLSVLWFRLFGGSR